jgi:hypothetical protein
LAGLEELFRSTKVEALPIGLWPKLFSVTSNTELGFKGVSYEPSNSNPDDIPDSDKDYILYRRPVYCSVQKELANWFMLRQICVVWVVTQVNRFVLIW